VKTARFDLLFIACCNIVFADKIEQLLEQEGGMDHRQIMVRQHKRLYLVRHGETNLNRENRSQPPEAELSALGLTQVGCLAARLIYVDFDRIISSDMERARATASVIAAFTDKEVTFSELLREMKRPSEIVGKHFDDASVAHVRRDVRFHERERDWYYSDEENIFDLCERAFKAKEYVNEQPERNMVVVSHGVFIRMFFCALVTETEENALSLYWNLKYCMHVNNASISVLEFSEFDGHVRWRVRTWNDFGHLT